ncbi:MAG: hypothetical protein V8R82_10020 [Clostridia bacterium]
MVKVPELNSEEYPNLEKNEEIGVLVQLIFQNNIELEKFELKLAFSNTNRSQMAPILVLQL